MINKLDSTFRFYEDAANLRAHRQQLIASNIANVDTPNFKARDINFKDALENTSGNRIVKLATNAPNHIASPGSGGGAAAAGSVDGCGGVARIAVPVLARHVGVLRRAVGLLRDGLDHLLVRHALAGQPLGPRVVDPVVVHHAHSQHRLVHAQPLRRAAPLNAPEVGGYCPDGRGGYGSGT